MPHIASYVYMVPFISRSSLIFSLLAVALLVGQATAQVAIDGFYPRSGSLGGGVL